MDIRSRIRRVAAILDENSPQDITFIEATDPFELLICVILSAQTTDRQVNIVAKKLFAAYPTAMELAAADEEQVRQIIRSTGFFNTKARNIIACSQALVEHHGGNVPLTMETLVTLPGAGRKTANCVLGNLLGAPAVIVDTHFARVVTRLGFVKESDPAKIEQRIRGLLPQYMLYRFSMTVNLHGRAVCDAKKPKCGSCLLRDLCPWSGKAAFLSN